MLAVNFPGDLSFGTEVAFLLNQKDLNQFFKGIQMTTLTKEPKRLTRKPSSSRNSKPGTATTENVFADLFNMVEDLFGPDIQKTVKK